jgi:hypothetical protein
MTIESFSTMPPVDDEDETKWSFLRALILAIVEGQQKAVEVRNKSAPEA